MKEITKGLQHTNLENKVPEVGLNPASPIMQFFRIWSTQSNAKKLFIFSCIREGFKKPCPLKTMAYNFKILIVIF